MSDGYCLRKTVLLRRGIRGYGFNLAEEYPCYLSAVHEGGVAWKAGLRTGDRLAGIGSLDVASMPHKDIVRMIADSGEVLRLTVLSLPPELIETARRGQTSSEDSSSDCDSDNEIWRKKKSDLAQKLQQKRPRRSRYKNLITPISEALLEDGFATGGSGILRKRGRRYISATDQRSIDRRVFCAIDQPMFDEPNAAYSRPPTSLDYNDFAMDTSRFNGQRILHSAMVHRPGSPPDARQAKRRPVSVLHVDDALLSVKEVGRSSRSPAKMAKRRTLSGGKKSMANRSSSAPDYKRGFHHKDAHEASTIVRVGLENNEQLSSEEDENCNGLSDSSDNEDEEEEEDLIKKSVVVYIGAVPVPTGGASRKNILKSALQSLRAQRVRAHTVLLEIFSTQIVITNSKGVMTNRFRADRIAYATSCAENKQYFGVITIVNDRGRQNRTTTTDETDDSPMAVRSDTDASGGMMVCHVFAVDPQLHLHSFHYHYARKFGIHCVRDPETNFCQEFPYSSNSILHAIGYVYRNHRNNHILNRFESDSSTVKGPFLHVGAAAYMSSNSDSGIGNGRDDFSPSAALRSAEFAPPAYPGASSRFASKTNTIERLSSPATPPISKPEAEEAEKEKTGSGGKKPKAVRFVDDQRNRDQPNGMDKVDRGVSIPSAEFEKRSSQAYVGFESKAALTCVTPISNPVNQNYHSYTMKNPSSSSTARNQGQSSTGDTGRRYATISGASASSAYAFAAAGASGATMDSSSSSAVRQASTATGTSGNGSSSINASGGRVAPSSSRSCHRHRVLAEAPLGTSGPGGDVDRLSSAEVVALPKSVADKKRIDEVQQRRTGLLEASFATALASASAELSSACNKGGGSNSNESKKPNTHYQTHYQQREGEEERQLATAGSGSAKAKSVSPPRIENFHSIVDHSAHYDLDHLHQHSYIDDQRRHSYHHTTLSGSNDDDQHRHRCTSGDNKALILSSTSASVAAAAAVVGSVSGRRKGSHQLLFGYHKQKPQRDSSGSRTFSGGALSILKRVGGAGKVVSSSTPRLVEDTAAADQSGLVHRLAPNLGYPDKTVSEQDLLDTVSDNPVPSTPTSRKESKDHSATRQGQPSAHYVSSSAIDVRQLASNSSKGIVRGAGPHKGALGATKSVAVGQILAHGSGVAGSAGEIRCNSPKNLGDSIEQLSSTSSSRQALSSAGSKFSGQQAAIGRESCVGSASSLFSTGDSGGLHQQVVTEPNSRCSTATSGTISTKHGSLLRDRINRRLNRNAGGDHTTTGGGIRTTSIRMKQALKERLEAWSSDFDRLLRDPAGLYAFSEFLRTQYCQENVNFWIACENYKLADENMRTHFATELYRSYFASGCMEPVNVDSLARQMIQEAMETENFTNTTFNPAQYQIFHLMKYDCYPRFLKSDEYQRCWELCEKGQQLPEMKEPFLNNVDLTSGSSLSLTTKTSCGGGGEEQKKSAASSRKSILPWKNKFSGGVNIIGRHKGKKEDDALTVGAQQPSTSTSSAVGAVAATGGGESAPGEMNTALSSVGSKRKQAWRHSKQLSTPADVTHAVRKPSGSVEGLHHLPMQARPSSGLTASKPDIIPQPDPPSSPSPGPHPRNAAHLQQHSKTTPGSPLLTTASHATSDGGKFSCTLILPSRERIQAAVSEDLTVRRWLHELALRYSLNAAATDIIDVDTDEPVDLATNASRALAGKTVRLEGGVLFKVDLPCSAASTPLGGGVHPSDATQRKLIAVKARADSAAGQVLRPILNKYGLQLDSMVVCVAGTNEVLPNHSPISLANNKKLMVLTQSEFEEWVHRDHDAVSLLSSRSSPSRSSLSPSFEDIIGAKYFQELPSHKGLGIAELPPEPEGIKGGRHHQATSTNGSHKHGAGGMLKFVKRGAAEATSSAATKILGQQTKSLRLSSHPNQQHVAGAAGSSSQHQGTAPGKKSVLSKQELLELAREEKRLAELLGRAQASSFDDQRGASVKNFELPDFLKQPAPLAVSHLGAAGAALGSGTAAGIQSSSMDDSLIPTSATGAAGGQHSTFYHSRPTDLVHRKLCGGSGVTTEETGGMSTASGSCDDDFISYEPLTERRGDEDNAEANDDLLKCVVTINGEKSEMVLSESKIPSHDEAEALFSSTGGDKEMVDFNDPMMTERRRLSDFGLNAPDAAGVSENTSPLDDTIRSASIDERVSASRTPPGVPRAPPPPYQRPRNISRSPAAAGNSPTPQVIKSATDTGIASPSCEQRKGTASVGDVTGILDQEKKRKGLYVHHQDDDWQVDYV